MSFASQMTRVDHVLVFVFHILPRKWSPWIAPPAFAAAVVLLHADEFADVLGALRRFALVSVAMFVAVIVLATALYAFRIWRLPSNSPALALAEITLEGAGVTFAGAGTRTTFEWSSITEVKETRRFVGVRHLGRAGNLYLLPRRCMPDGALRELHSLFEASRDLTGPRKPGTS